MVVVSVCVYLISLKQDFAVSCTFHSHIQLHVTSFQSTKLWKLNERGIILFLQIHLGFREGKWMFLEQMGSIRSFLLNRYKMTAQNFLWSYVTITRSLPTYVAMCGFVRKRLSFFSHPLPCPNNAITLLKIWARTYAVELAPTCALLTVITVALLEKN